MEDNTQQSPNGPLPKPPRKWHPKHQPWYIVAAIALVLGLAVGGTYFTYKKTDDNSLLKSGSLTQEEQKGGVDTSVTNLATLQETQDPTKIQGRIGVIGCSNTSQHTEGYGRLSDKDTLWYQGVDTGGGSLEAWYTQIGNTRGYWKYFTDSVNEKGADAIWFQICMRQHETSAGGMTNEQQVRVTAVVKEARRIVGSNVDVYISPLNFYADNNCSTTGKYAVSNGVELADWAVATELAFRGPDTGPLESNMLADDGCHLNDAGKDLVGQQMVSFFDNGNIVILPPDPDPNPKPDPDPTPTPTPDPKSQPNPSPTPNPTSSGRPVISFVYTPSTVSAGQQVHFINQTTDDGYILKWRWIFEDGTVLYEQNPTHIFQKSGSYRVRLQVVDNEGYRSIKTQTVIVQ